VAKLRKICFLGVIGIIGLVICSTLFSSDIGWKGSGKGGAVAAGKAASVAAGISILEQGGNAADSAVATLLALSVTDYGFFAIGAEVPFIIYDAKRKEVKVLCGLGGAPLDPESIAWFYKNDIPSKGSLKAAPVPGAMSLCMAALKLYGTISFEQAVTPTLTILDAGGEDWYKNLASTFRRLIETERKTNGTREDKIQAARDRFYKGDIADELEAYYIKNGGFLRKADLAAHVTRVEDPVTVQYRGYTINKCDTWTQGPFLCQTLRLLEGFDLKKMGHLSADYIHVLTEALKLGFADRDQYYGDPLFTNVPIKALLCDEYTALRRPLIDMEKASAEIRPGDPVNMKALKGPGEYRPGPGGTTTCVVADRWGNMVAATPSGNRPYSLCSELGIAHGNRLRSLNTTRGHPNRIEPGKRPRITLTPTIVLKDGKAVMAISVAGGDRQDQTTLNCLLNHLEFGMLPEQAVTADRFYTRTQQSSFDPNPVRLETLGPLASLVVNDSIDEKVREQLANRGHKLTTTSDAIARPVMIYRNPDTEMLYAAGDPKAGRHAAALAEKNNPKVASEPKIKLRDVVAAARTWGPAFQNWVGKDAPDFTLTDLEGKVHKLSDYRGRNVMLVFWATWCPPCRMEIPHLIDLRNRIKEDELVILAIAYRTPRNTKEMVEQFVKQMEVINYTVISAKESDLSTPFNRINSIPSSFFIDPEGKIKLATVGLLSLPDMTAIIKGE